MMKGALCLLLIGLVNLAMADIIINNGAANQGNGHRYTAMANGGNNANNNGGDTFVTNYGIVYQDAKTTNHLSFSKNVGSNVTQLNVDQTTGVNYNTLGVTLARHDYAPNGGLSPPHIHPHATEVLAVVQGGLYAGFVTSEPENRLVAKVLKAGDVFVFPAGLLHFQSNIGNTSAVAIASFNSQNPGLVTIANAAFRSNPPIFPDILSKAFQLDKNVIKHLQTQQF